MAAFLKLSCAVQTYAWGKYGNNSEVAKLMSSDPSFELNHDQPYAELWMGTHGKGPSSISYPQELEGVPLSSWINDNQWSLGDKVAKEFGGNLPFLFKTLSINKALSIQAHPTKDHAQLLHHQSPGHYPDPNHKPELVIAITQFEGLCGFRPFSEIQSFITSIPELATVLGPQIVELVTADNCKKNEEELRQVLKSCFTALMCQESDIVMRELEKLNTRLQNGHSSGFSSQVIDLFTRLYTWYPGDVGCWCTFFLNYFSLEEGQSLYLAPNEPHAYISGDVVECMACSDNVVRAGLTPKFRDKDTLCNMLSYYMRTPLETLFHSKPHPSLKQVTIYDPPTPEFAVAKISFTHNVVVPGVNGPSIFLVLNGAGQIICNSVEESYTKGSVLFVPSGRSVEFKSLNETSPSIIYQAYCQL